METKTQIFRDIERLKEEREAVILAHVYQRAEIQDIADFVGDSLDLSKKAVATNAKVIVFCGVRFMAETAAILNPYKTVLLPDMNAGCELANLASARHLQTAKKQNPDAVVVSYINSSAEIKAESDVCCTSANAIDVVNTIPNNPVLFLPDRNLASHVAEKTKKEVISWYGYCYVHENITVAQIEALKGEHPDAVVIVHPECPQSVRHLASYVGSTSQMSRYVAKSSRLEFIVGTEMNFTYRLERDNPGKKFYPVDSVCEGMNTITLAKIKTALERLQYQIHVPEEIRQNAKGALDRMLNS